MKRVALISEHASPLAIPGGVDAGGQNIYVKEVARQLVNYGFAVDIFTRREHRNYPRKVNLMKGVRVVYIDAGPPTYIEKERLLPFMAAFRDDMLAFMKDEEIQYDLLHANFFMSALVAMELKTILKIPFVVTYHALGYVRKLYQGDSDRFPATRLEIEQQSMDLADAIIAECPQDKEDILQFYKVDPEKVVVIPCGINPQEMYPINRQLARLILKIPETDKVILQLGRIVPRKGIDNVIQAMSHLQCRSQHIRLIIVGGEMQSFHLNYEVQRLRQLARTLGISYAIQFVGHKTREELKYYYSAADVFVTTPWYEPFGITPLEAMACGVPVIGANVGGIKYSVVDGQTGKLVPSRDPVSLADSITELLGNADLRKQMGQMAIKRVRKLFTWQRVTAHISMLYETIIDNLYMSEKKLKNVI